MPAKSNTIAITTPTQSPLPPPTPLPPDVLARFPSLVEWHKKEVERVKKMQVALMGVPSINT